MRYCTIQNNAFVSNFDCVSVTSIRFFKNVTENSLTVLVVCRGNYFYLHVILRQHTW